MPGENANMTLTWLHLSDWHQKGPDFDRTVVRDKLIQDIQNRKNIHPDLGKIDFIVFSGDLAYHGKKEEFESAWQLFLEPVLKAANVSKDRLVIVPGNHDLDRDSFELLPEPLKKPLTTHEEIIKWLDNETRRQEILKPFKDYTQFIQNTLGNRLTPYACEMTIPLETPGKSAAVMGFNSALMCARNKNASGEVDDDRKIITGEPQIYPLVEKNKAAHIRIAVMHHPLDWLTECDRVKVETTLKQNVHIILCGHLHKGAVEIIAGTAGQCIVIPVGAAYERRNYFNGYNYVSLDTRTGTGTVFFRQWNINKSLWQLYFDPAHPQGAYSFTIPGFAPGHEKHDEKEETPGGDKPGLKPVTEPGDKPGPGPGAMYNLDHCAFNVPFCSKGDGMVGREESLLKVREQLEKGKRTSIGHTAAFQGIGGLGKTQLAVEYAHRYKDLYPKGVIWIDADCEIDPQLIAVAKQAKWISPESKPSDILDMAKHRLTHWSECLVIFDNVEHHNRIQEYLPAVDAEPHLLVTSRITIPHFHPVDILLLDSASSLELLRIESGRDFDALSPGEKEAAQAVADKLEGLPLAIEIAGAYLAHISTCSFCEYQTLLEANLKEALSGHMLSSCTRHECDLFATLKISEPVLKEAPLLKEIIDILAWSGSAFMGVSLLAALLDKKEVELITPLNLGATLKILQKSENGKRYDLHRLVRKVHQEQNPIDKMSEWVDRVCGRLGKWFEDRGEEFLNLPEFEAELDHLKEWLKHAQPLFPLHAARLTWLQAYPPLHWGKYNESHKLVQSAFSILDKIEEAGMDLKLKADILNDLGSTSASLGNYPDALNFSRQALAIRLNLFKENHPDTADSYNNIGITLDKIGKNDEALESHEKALSIKLQVLGEQHPDTAISYGNIGSTLDKIGNHKEALENEKKALAIQLKVLGELHPNSATSYNNIGITLVEMGKHVEALESYEKALAIQLQVLGELHPNTATSYNNIGSVLYKLGKYVEALQYVEKTLAIRLQLLGELDPKTTDCAFGVIQCLIKLHRFPEASEQLEEWLDRLPPDHADFKKLEAFKNIIKNEQRKSMSGTPGKKKRR